MSTTGVSLAKSPSAWSFNQFLTGGQIAAEAIAQSPDGSFLEKLPTELRLMIYEFVLYDEDGLIFCDHDRDKVARGVRQFREFLPRRFRSLADGPIHRIVEKSLLTKADVSILKTCRSIRNEALGSFYSVNKVVFYGVATPEDFNSYSDDFETYVETTRTDIVSRSKRFEVRYFADTVQRVRNLPWFAAQNHAIKTQLKTSTDVRATLTIAVNIVITPQLTVALENFRTTGLFSPKFGVEVTGVGNVLSRSSSAVLITPNLKQKRLIIEKVHQIEKERLTRPSFKENKQLQSPFLAELPPRIRRMIYEYVLFSPTGLEFIQETWKKGFGDIDRHRRAEGSFQTDINPAILRTCRMIRNEAQYVALRVNSLRFSHSHWDSPASGLATHLYGLQDRHASLERVSIFHFCFDSSSTSKYGSTTDRYYWLTEHLQSLKLTRLLERFPLITIAVNLKITPPDLYQPSSLFLIHGIKLARDLLCFCPRVRPQLEVDSVFSRPRAYEHRSLCNTDVMRCLGIIEELVAEIHRDFCDTERDPTYASSL